MLVDALLTSPGGAGVTYPCFWYEGSDGWKGWKLRFAPTEAGTWKVRFRVRHASGTAMSDQASFDCVVGAATGSCASIPLDPRACATATGRPSTPSGWARKATTASSWTQKINDLFPEMKANGVNYVR